MSTEKDEHAAAHADVPVQPAELDGTALDLAVGGATLSTTPVLVSTTGKEDTRKGLQVGNENQFKGSILPGTNNSTPG